MLLSRSGLSQRMFKTSLLINRPTNHLTLPSLPLPSRPADNYESDLKLHPAPSQYTGKKYNERISELCLFLLDGVEATYGDLCLNRC
jgi:hypothetical protein